MNNKNQSSVHSTNLGHAKIVVIILALVIVGVGVYVVGSQSEKVVPPASEPLLKSVFPLKDEKLDKAAWAVGGFVESGKLRDYKAARTFLTPRLARDYNPVGMSNPHQGSFLIYSIKRLSDGTYEAKTREYEEYTGQGIIGHRDVTYIVIEQDSRFLIEDWHHQPFVQL